MEYEVVSGIPAPEPKKRGRPTKYPWAEMKSGDSFWVPVHNGRSVYMARTSAQNSARAWFARNRYCECKTVSVNEGDGFRIWVFFEEGET